MFRILWGAPTTLERDSSSGLFIYSFAALPLVCICVCVCLFAIFCVKGYSGDTKATTAAAAAAEGAAEAEAEAVLPLNNRQTERQHNALCARVVRVARQAAAFAYLDA